MIFTFVILLRAEICALSVHSAGRPPSQLKQANQDDMGKNFHEPQTPKRIPKEGWKEHLDTLTQDPRQQANPRGCRLLVNPHCRSPRSLVAMTSHLVAMASNLRAMASNLIAMASNLIAMSSNLIGMASNLLAMASNLHYVFCLLW